MTITYQGTNNKGHHVFTSDDLEYVTMTDLCLQEDFGRMDFEEGEEIEVPFDYFTDCPTYENIEDIIKAEK